MTSLVDRLAQDPSILAIVALGSAIRDVPASADIDLLVIYESHRPDFGRPPIDVDTRAYEASVAEGMVRGGHDLLGWAIRLGCAIWQRGKYWDLFVHRLRAQSPFPSASVALERAKRASRLLEHMLVLGDDDAAREQLVTMLTHVARARLIQGGVYPTSRPELSAQLEEIGETRLATQLKAALTENTPADGIWSEFCREERDLVESFH